MQTCTTPIKCWQICEGSSIWSYVVDLFTLTLELSSSVRSVAGGGEQQQDVRRGAGSRAACWCWCWPHHTTPGKLELENKLLSAIWPPGAASTACCLHHPLCAITGSIGMRHVTKTLMIDKAFPITRILKITSHLGTDKVVPSLKRADMRLARRVGTNWL